MSPSPSTSVVSPEDQSATFVELFFDLVFVFSVTQVVGLLHHHLDWVGVGQTVLVFWLVWWAWSQFTWALNAADTTNPWVELGTLLATAVAFFMAVALPRAFSGGALWFAVPYVLVRVVGLALYIWVSWVSSASHHSAVRTFAALSIGGLVVVIAGGVLGGSAVYACWGLAIVLDLVAAIVGGGTGEWNLHPEHFAERHGLFVIIALGETLIVAAGGLTGVAMTPTLATIGALAVAIACALWWSYFVCAKPVVDRALESAAGKRQSATATMARDAYTLLHFVMMLGVITFAVAIEGVVLHPDDALGVATRLALGIGVLLFPGGMALSMWRATGRLPVARLGLAAATAACVGLLGQRPIPALAVALGGVVAIALVESRTGSATTDEVPIP